MKNRKDFKVIEIMFEKWNNMKGILKWYILSFTFIVTALSLFVVGGIVALLEIVPGLTPVAFISSFQMFAILILTGLGLPGFAHYIFSAMKRSSKL